MYTHIITYTYIYIYTPINTSVITRNDNNLFDSEIDAILALTFSREGPSPAAILHIQSCSVEVNSNTHIKIVIFKCVNNHMNINKVMFMLLIIIVVSM